MITTIEGLIDALTREALRQPNVREVFLWNVLQLNGRTSINYGVFAVTPDIITLTDDTLEVGLNLYYIDRLTDNETNETAIYSEGVATLTAIRNGMAEQYDATSGDASFSFFRQRFKDECAGVMMRCAFVISNGVGICE